MKELIKAISDILIQLDTKLGFRKILVYIILILIIIALLNYKKIIEDATIMIERNNYNKTLKSVKYRAQVSKIIDQVLWNTVDNIDCDNIIIFEYHDNIANFGLIHFKFMTLSYIVGKGLSYGSIRDMESLNTSIISPLIDAVDNNGYVILTDTRENKSKYPSSSILFDTSKSDYLFVDIKNSENVSLGIIILAWSRPEKVEPVPEDVWERRILDGFDLAKFAGSILGTENTKKISEINSSSVPANQ